MAVLELDEEQSEPVAVVARDRARQDVLLRVGEDADAAVADVLEERGLVEQAQDEGAVIRGEATEHQAVGFKDNHVEAPPPERCRRLDYMPLAARRADRGGPE